MNAAPLVSDTPSGGFIWCHMCCWRRPGGGPGDEDGLVTKHVKYYSRMSESDSNIELSQVRLSPDTRSKFFQKFFLEFPFPLVLFLIQQRIRRVPEPETVVPSDFSRRVPTSRWRLRRWTDTDIDDS